MISRTTLIHNMHIFFYHDARKKRILKYSLIFLNSKMDDPQLQPNRSERLHQQQEIVIATVVSRIKTMIDCLKSTLQSRESTVTEPSVETDMNTTIMRYLDAYELQVNSLVKSREELKEQIQTL